MAISALKQDKIKNLAPKKGRGLFRGTTLVIAIRLQSLHLHNDFYAGIPLQQLLVPEAACEVNFNILTFL